MNSAQTTSISQLPLSWARTNRTEPMFDVVDLPLAAPDWIPSAEIPHNYSFDQLYHEHLSQLPNGFVLQNCSLPLRNYLIEQGCQVAAMGAEAVLDLPWRGKRSVRELARRGQRHGSVHEVEWSQYHQNKLDQLISESPSRQGVQLRYTERSGFDASTRCFVFETAEKKWMGAVTLSTTASDYVHTEMILRHQESPNGIMEAMITAITQQLALEGVSHLSLGNVTPLPAAESDAIFSAHRHPQELWMRSQLTFRLGRALNFAYNADGLWKFKNKFSPRWEPLYLCASPHLSWATVAGLIQATGYFDLVLNQLRDASLRSVPSLRLPLPQLDGLLPFGPAAQRGA
ncbi:MAG: phosphatidylglycerol lysyltransferase domain-containing protein [Chloroflexota bacterium]